MLKKPVEDLIIEVLVPCYKRPEYTRKCIKALEEAQEYNLRTEFILADDGSQDETEEILKSTELHASYIFHKENKGLRTTVLEFLEAMKQRKPDIIAKVDSDCAVPKNWLDDILKVLKESPADILSPNVYPSNAAFVYGTEDVKGHGYRPAKTVGGLWVMKREFIDDVHFERHDLNGITGAYNLLYQIIIEKEPVVGWVPGVVVQDIGHWSGQHPDHIKSMEHELYYAEVGRKTGW